jgi:homocysteine S-methyltransferase
MDKSNSLFQNKHSKSRPLVLDGAIGSLLQMRGFELDKYLWSSRMNIEKPEIIKSIHEEYIEAGADIITTNTFRTNPVAKKYSNISITNSDLVTQSVELAKKASKEFNVIIAGSNAPAEDCYQQKRTINMFDLEYNHKKHIELLWEAGVDIIWNETHSHFDEIEIICKFCNESKIPFTINLFCNDKLELLSGEPVKDICYYIIEYSPLAIGLNCISLQTFKKYYDRNTNALSNGFYLNCGQSKIMENDIKSSIFPEEYLKSIKEFLAPNLLFVGSCCGSSPLHTKQLRETIDAIYRN